MHGYTKTSFIGSDTGGEFIDYYGFYGREELKMKQEPDYKLKKRLERMEHEKKMNRTYNRNWIICIGSLAIIILAVFVFGGK